MTTARGRGRPPKLNSQAEQLQIALNFVGGAVGNDNAELWTRHIRFGNKQVVAFNGQVSAGHPIVEELDCCPHYERTKIALGKCGKSLALTQTPTGKLSIKGEKINALVDGLPAENMPQVWPDPSCAVISDVLKEAFRVTGVLASEAAFEVVTASLLLEANVVTGTNKQSMLQFWHGIDLPPKMVIPKIFAAAVAKQVQPLTGFGFTWDNERGCVTSVTFWFDNGAWIKTQTYLDRWPDVDRILNVPSNPMPVPANFFEAIAVISEFNEDGYVTIGDNRIQSHRSDKEGAYYEVPGLQPGLQLSGKLSKNVAPYVSTIDMTTNGGKIIFFGGTPENGIRGALMGIVESSHGAVREDEGPVEIEDESEEEDEDAG